MIEKALQIPRWDRDVDFLDLDSCSFRATFQATVAEIDRLVSDFDLRDIHARDTPLAAAPSEDALEAFVERLDAVVAQARHLSTCLYCSIQIDARDERARALWSEFQSYLASLDQLQSRLVSWIGRLNADDLREGSPFRREYAFLLKKAQARGEHVMPSGEEDLAAQLRVVSSHAWGRMREAIVSSLRFAIEVNGERTGASSSSSFATTRPDLAIWPNVLLPRTGSTWNRGQARPPGVSAGCCKMASRAYSTTTRLLSTTFLVWRTSSGMPTITWQIDQPSTTFPIRLATCSRIACTRAIRTIARRSQRSLMRSSPPLARDRSRS